MEQTSNRPVYKRVLLKMSGEILMGNTSFGLDPTVLDRLAEEIAEVSRLNVEIGLVIGGGNLFRGADLSDAGLDRVTGDNMGMLATLMNALALRDALERADIPTRIMSAINMTGIVDPFDLRKADYHLKHSRVVIFAGGTGNPFFTTDSAASLRGIEIKADVLLKGTKVDGVYSADPVKDKTATRYTKLSYTEVIERDLKVMDITSVCMCRDQGLPILVFDITKKGSLLKVVLGKDDGTLIQ